MNASRRSGIIVRDDAGHADAAAGRNAAGFDVRQERLDFVAARRSSGRRARAARGGAAAEEGDDGENPVPAVRGHTPRRRSTGPQAIHRVRSHSLSSTALGASRRPADAGAGGGKVAQSGVWPPTP